MRSAPSAWRLLAKHMPGRQVRTAHDIVREPEYAFLILQALVKAEARPLPCAFGRRSIPSSSRPGQGRVLPAHGETRATAPLDALSRESNGALFSTSEKALCHIPLSGRPVPRQLWPPGPGTQSKKGCDGRRIHRSSLLELQGVFRGHDREAEGAQRHSARASLRSAWRGGTQRPIHSLARLRWDPPW